MSRAPKGRRYASALVPFVLAMARTEGLDTRALEKKYLHVGPGGGTPEVSLDDLGGLFTEVSEALKDPLFGLHAALAMPRGAYGLLEFGLRSAPTGRLAMEQLATYGVLINPLVRWSLELDGDEVSLHHRAARPGGVGAQGNVFTVARILQVAREMLGDDVKPVHVWFAHEASGCPPALAGFLETDQVRFGRASSGLAFAVQTLNRKPVGADPALNRALELHGAAMLAQCGGEDPYQQARNAVLTLLPHGEATLAKTARRLHLTARTLQRRLQDEGVTFASLLNEVRRAQAERLLSRTELSLTQVAEQVGYGDTAAFVRAFRGWTGTTPGRFRAG